MAQGLRKYAGAPPDAPGSHISSEYDAVLFQTVLDPLERAAHLCKHVEEQVCSDTLGKVAACGRRLLLNRRLAKSCITM